MITLSQSLTSKLTPCLTTSILALSLILNQKSAFNRSINVSTSKRKTETSLGFPYKVQCNLWESLGLKVSYNGTSTKTTMLDHMHNLPILFLGKGKFELRFGSINTDNLGPRLPIKTKQGILHDHLCINGSIQSTNRPRIPRRQNILDMMKCRIHENLIRGPTRRTRIPRPRLNPHRIRNTTELIQLPISNNHPKLAQNGNFTSIR
mmetsp:Transcript_28037/g.41599  ORF Transcript_28037/g.41599 Transcript_28037/m.41599 type:complete len:206 (+) Transcript_28037:1688-2305(+)